MELSIGYFLELAEEQITEIIGELQLVVVVGLDKSKNNDNNMES